MCFCVGRWVQRSDENILCVTSVSVLYRIDPNHVGMEPLDDDAIRPLEDILLTRQKYFEEGSEVARLFMESYGKERRILYNDRDETYDNMRYGMAFLFATILVDWYVCIM